MRFTYLELENYIGVYNGMGLTNIQIDLSRCRNRILIIRGENGSGKSTIFNALNIFPDSNDMFIPGMPAKKVICLLDGINFYTFRFIHGVKNNGDRDTTRAYVSKRVNGLDIELNESGNVTSFKDIVHNELSLDPNFIALSQLSLYDRGLADKKPAERKKYVNSIVESLEVYNNICKIFTKKASTIKTMVDSVVTKLGSLGNINILTQSLINIENEINALNEKKDLATKDLMKYTSMIELLDPDKSIQNTSAALSLESAEINKKLLAMVRKCTYYIVSGPIELLKRVDDEIAGLTKHNEIDQYEIERAKHELGNIESILASLNAELSDKQIKADTISSDISYEDAMDKYAVYQAEVNEYLEAMKVTGIDPNLFTKDEYILALETLKDIKTHIDLFRDRHSYASITESVSLYENNGWKVMPILATQPIEDEIKRIIEQYSSYPSLIATCESEIDQLKALANRPSSCKEDSCYFISNLIEIKNRDPEKQLERYTTEYNKAMERQKDLENKLAHDVEINACLNEIRVIIREIDKNGSILSRLPNGGIFSSKQELFNHLLTGDDFSYMDKMYSYLDFSNMVEQYHVSFNLMGEYKNKVDLYLSKSEILGSLDSDIANIRKEQYTYTATFTELRNLINSYENDIQDRISKLDKLIKDRVDIATMAEMEEKLNSINRKLLDMNISITRIHECNGHIAYLSDQIRDISNQIIPKMRERDTISYSIKQIDDYNIELEELRKEYDRVETIRYYSSPTKGIQLVFMELYMGKILALANELLALFFSGEYRIQPFVINESEFRIPCLGGGYLNDDISSMSASQVTMISMIISFALLHTSSTRYNILKMDEIDAPLDENNRIIFLDVMNRIMDIMNVEQCCMISHNSELQADNVDVIVLKSTQLSTDFTRGNIVWKY